MLIDNVRFRVAVDVAVLDPVPELQRSSGVSTDPETLSQFGTLVDKVAADSANRIVLRLKSNFVGERLKITVVNDRGVPSTSVI